MKQLHSLQLCPFSHCAVMMSWKGMFDPHAGQLSSSDVGIRASEEMGIPRPLSFSARCWTLSNKSGGQRGRLDCTTRRRMNGMSSAIENRLNMYMIYTWKRRTNFGELEQLPLGAGPRPSKCGEICRLKVSVQCGHRLPASRGLDRFSRRHISISGDTERVLQAYPSVICYG